jgi:hypothetical protein
MFWNTSRHLGVRAGGARRAISTSSLRFSTPRKIEATAITSPLRRYRTKQLRAVMLPSMSVVDREMHQRQAARGEKPVGAALHVLGGRELAPAIGWPASIPIGDLVEPAWSRDAVSFATSTASFSVAPRSGGGGTRKSLPDEMTQVFQVPASRSGAIACSAEAAMTPDSNRKIAAQPLCTMRIATSLS